MITKRLKRSQRKRNRTNEKRHTKNNRSFEVSGNNATPTLKFQNCIFGNMVQMIQSRGQIPVGFPVRLRPNQITT